MPDSIDFEMTMKDQEVEVALQNLFTKSTKVEEGMGRAGRAGKKAGQEAKQGIDAWQKQLEKTRESQEGLSRAAFVSAKAAKQTGDAWEQQLKRTQAAADAAAKAIRKPVDDFVNARRSESKGDAWTEQQQKTSKRSGGKDYWTEQLEKTTRARQAETAAIEEQREAQEKLNAAERKSQADKLAKETKKLAEEVKKADVEITKFADDVKRINSTPLERFEQRMQKVNFALAMGKLDVHQYGRETARLRKELEEETKAAEGAGEANKESFGNESIAALGRYALGVFSIKKAIDLAKQAWDDYAQTRTKALDSSLAGDASLRKLAQIAPPGQLEAMKQQTDAYSGKYGIEQQEVIDAQFEAGWSGLSDRAVEDSMRASAFGADPSNDVAFMGSVKSLYGDEMDPRKAYRVAIQAAKDSKLDMVDFTGRMPETLNPAKALGLSIEETSAIASEISPAFGKETFARMNDLFGGMALDKRFQGKGMAGFQEMMGLNDEQLEGVIGKDRQKNFAFREIRDRFGKIQDTAKRYQQVAADTDTDRDVLTSGVEEALKNPTLRNNFELKREQQKLRISREKNLAGPESQSQRSLAEEQRRIEQEKMDFGERTGTDWAARGAAYMGGKPEDVKSAGGWGQSLARLWRGDAVGAVVAAGAGKARATQELNPQIDQTNTLLKEIRDNLKPKTESRRSSPPPNPMPRSRANP